MSDFGINHESGALKRVMVHHPGKELKLANADPVAHHFDQPVDIKRFISDHQELVDALEDMSSDLFEEHVNEMKNDFSNWVRDVLGDDKLANELTNCANRTEAVKTVRDRIAWLQKKLK